MVVFQKDHYICSPKQTNIARYITSATQSEHHGMWRSSVACLHGVQEVAGSNPVIPTLIKSPYNFVCKGFFVVYFFEIGLGFYI